MSGLLISAGPTLLWVDSSQAGYAGERIEFDLAFQVLRIRKYRTLVVQQWSIFHAP